MVSKRTAQRRRSSKRQKRRSLKRRNVKSRKVMRGGEGGDPLQNVDVNNLVFLEITPTPKAFSADIKKHREETPTIPAPIYASIFCKVLSVTQPDLSSSKKTVKLKITNDDKIKVCNMIDNDQGDCSDEFEIIYNPDRINESKYPYYFKNSNPQVEYKYVKQEDSSIVFNPFFIIKVQRLTA